MKKKQSLEYIKKLQILCLALCTFSLEWALWTEFSFNTMLLSLSCVLVVVLAFFSAIDNMLSIKWIKLIPEYIHFIIWIIIMIIANHFFYRGFREITFLFITMDAHAIFFLRLLISVIPLMFFVDTNTFKETFAFKVILGIIVLSNALFTFRAVRIFPDAIRARSTMEHIGAEEYLFATPDYAMVYSMALIFPVFLQKWKLAAPKSKDKLFYALCSILTFYTIMVSQFATALLIAIIGAILFLLFSMKNTKRIFITTTIFIILLTVHLGRFDVALLNLFAEIVPGSWADKLHDFAITLSNNSLSGSLSVRTDLYKQSFSVFLESPLVGIMKNSMGTLGGHATAIDILGLTGLLGFIPFALMYIYNVRRLCRTCDFWKNKAPIVACCVEFVVLVFSKNIITSLSIFLAFFVLLPLFLKIENDKEGEKTR